MTVIAWDGKTLAADKMATFGGTPVPTTKIFQIGAELIGCSGLVSECLQFVEWYRKGEPADSKPVFEEGFSALVVQNGKLYKYERQLVPLHLPVPVWGAGSGADYAIGAMAAGKTAVEAVEIACRFDVNCGLGVDSFTVGSEA